MDADLIIQHLEANAQMIEAILQHEQGLKVIMLVAVGFLRGQ